MIWQYPSRNIHSINYSVDTNDSTGNLPQGYKHKEGKALFHCSIIHCNLKNTINWLSKNRLVKVEVYGCGKILCNYWNDSETLLVWQNSKKAWKNTEVHLCYHYNYTKLCVHM